MKLEKFNYSSGKKSRWFLYGFIMCAILMVLVNLFFSQAKYLNTESVKIAEGSISYKPNELNLVAVNIENDNGDYDYSEDIPTSGYYLDDSKSYCEVKNVKDNSIRIEYTGSKLEVSDITKKGTRCYVYFNKSKSKTCPSGASACETIMANINTIGERNNITGPLSATTTKIIYQAEDNDGTSYYFSGNPTDNWVKFAGFYWRIIRINGDGSIRLIYTGTEASGPTNEGTTTQIGTSKYNMGYHDNAYVGYMYGNVGSSTYEETHANINDSTIKDYIDNWYTNNLTSYESYLDNNAGFCNDRKTVLNGYDGFGDLGYGINITSYAPFGRVKANNKRLEVQNPSLKCNQSNDLFTLNISNKGNKMLDYPIGLITMDELTFAGNVVEMYNIDNYLFSNQSYWTMSPAHYEGNSSYVYQMSQTGYASSGSYVGNYYGVRPVINLRFDVILTGTGTIVNPYVVS